MADRPNLTTAQGEVTLDKIVALCKRRGFIFPSSEIYGGIGSTYDYGHYGVLLKNNVKAEWWRAMLQERDDIVAIDSAIIQHPKVWEASGHLEGFSDPLVQCLGECKQRWREDHCARSSSAPRTPRARSTARSAAASSRSRASSTSCSRPTWARSQDDAAKVYLRPETAQGIFINFKNVLQFARKKPPFGIAQIGKSFRNEITTGNFVFRTREFEQMEMEFFVPPDEAAEVARALAGGADALVHRARHPRRPAAASGARRGRALPLLQRHLRHRVPVPDGLLASWRGSPTAATSTSPSTRSSPARSSSTSTRGTGDRYVPHVIEPAAGVDRAMLAFMVDAYDEEEVEGRERVLLRLHPRLAPVKVAVLPLVNKDGQPEKAREIFEELRERMPAEYDTGGSIGKRYRRQDEIGTPWGVTVDHQTMEDDTVTLRDRDTLDQSRIAISELGDELEQRLKAPWTSPKS